MPEHILGRATHRPGKSTRPLRICDHRATAALHCLRDAPASPFTVRLMGSLGDRQTALIPNKQKVL